MTLDKTKADYSLYKKDLRVGQRRLAVTTTTP